MNRFDDSTLLDGLAEAGAIDNDTVDALAEAIASFHDTIAAVSPSVTGSDTPGESPAAAVRAPVMDNFTTLEELDHDPDDDVRQSLTGEWVEPEFERLAATFERRCEDGFVRDYHGYLHRQHFHGGAAPACSIGHRVQS
ncbi:MAG: hypothetical protein U5O39_15620 [Gammaproteobacteria bacterium]|nr:hypothetical protein [Gammaproteobacteria bacterium]